jgi:hypothetical protein
MKVMSISCGGYHNGHAAGSRRGAPPRTGNHEIQTGLFLGSFSFPVRPGGARG